MNTLIIRSLKSEDYAQWLPLWNDNNLGQCNDAVTAETWARICDSSNTQVNGLCADMGGTLIGITHYILHPTTGSIALVCYMQDVYVDLKHRRKNVGKRLVQALADIAHKEKWARMYWIAQNDSAPAQAMYENFGVKLNFSFYIQPTS